MSLKQKKLIFEPMIKWNHNIIHLGRRWKKRQKQTEEELSKRKCTLNGNSYTSNTSLLFWFLGDLPQLAIEEFVLF